MFNTKRHTKIKLESFNVINITLLNSCNGNTTTQPLRCNLLLHSLWIWMNSSQYHFFGDKHGIGSNPRIFRIWTKSFLKNQRIQLEVLYNSAKLKFKIPKKFMTFEHICEGWSNFRIVTVLVKCQLRVKFWLFSLSFECPFSPAIYPLSTTVIVFSDFSVVLRALFSCL